MYGDEVIKMQATMLCCMYKDFYSKEAPMSQEEITTLVQDTANAALSSFNNVICFDGCYVTDHPSEFAKEMICRINESFEFVISQEKVKRFIDWCIRMRMGAILDFYRIHYNLKYENKKGVLFPEAELAYALVIMIFAVYVDAVRICIINDERLEYIDKNVSASKVLLGNDLYVFLDKTCILCLQPDEDGQH